MPTPDTFELPVINPNPRKPHLYGPHNPPPARGRMKGSINRVTKDLKLGLLDAAESLGEDGNGKNGLTGYLRYVGINHPKAFCHLLAKLMPLQVTSNGLANTSPVSINIVSIPHDHYLSNEDIAKLQGEPLEPAEHYEPAAIAAPEDVKLSVKCALCGQCA